MANVGDIYACKRCGVTVQVVAGGAGKLVCCGQDMEFIRNIDDDED